MVSDLGKGFIADLTQKVLKALTTNHQPVTAYHQSANGLVERANHVFADLMAMYVKPDAKDWDETIPLLTFAFNTAKQDTTGFSPYYLLYGRQPRLPIDFQFGSTADAVVAQD